MSKTKRMTLIEKDELERLRQRQVKEFDPLLQTRADVKDEMRTNFNRRDIGAFEKMTLYRMLKRMMNELEEPYKPAPKKAAREHEALETPLRVENPPDTPIRDEEHSDDASEIPDPRLEMINRIREEIEHSLPTKHREKAQDVLDYILDHPNSINVNAKGELILNRKTVRGSSLADLIINVYKIAPDQNLTAKESFRNALKPVKHLLSSSHRISRKAPKEGRAPPGHHPHVLMLYK